MVTGRRVRYVKYTKWEVAGYDRGEAARWFRSGINPLTSVLLASRGITDEKGLDEITDNRITSLHDPFLLDGMRAAVDRINDAVKNGEKIGIFGHYAVDGITSTCLLIRYFRSRGVECTNYIPERLEDGYGLQKKGIEQLKNSGVTLVVSVDCGITAFKAADWADSAGVDLIITDHHEAAETLPKAVAVVDPKLPNQAYPNKYLSGVGVAFKLVCAIEGGENTEDMVRQYGDLVAAGTISDVMPLCGENRILVRRGLDMLRRGSHVGFEKLAQQAGIDIKGLGTVGMSFMLAPRINAAGRLGKTGIAKDLLMTDDAFEANELAHQLCELNYERQKIEGQMMAEAQEMMEDYPDNAPIVLSSRRWHQGIAGIVASRVMEKYGRPAVIISIQDGEAKGSCRSFGEFSIYDAIKANEGVLLSFGGHKYASGIVLKEEDIDAFRRGLTEYYRKFYNGKAEETTVLKIDFEVIKPVILTLEM